MYHLMPDNWGASPSSIKGCFTNILEVASLERSTTHICVGDSGVLMTSLNPSALDYFTNHLTEPMVS